MLPRPTPGCLQPDALGPAERSSPIITRSVLARPSVARGARSNAPSSSWRVESASSQLCGATQGCICFPSISGRRNAFFHHSEDWLVLTHPLAPCPVTQERVLSPTPQGWTQQRSLGGQGWMRTTFPPTAGEHPSALLRPFQLHVLA